MTNNNYKINYNNSSLGIPNSILTHFGAKAHHETLPILDEKLKKNYKNVVLLILDGMGMDMLKAHSPDGFFIKNCISQICTVYPCTTTSALTTFETGLSPLEHGWLGWSHYFKEIGKCVNLFNNKETGTDHLASENNVVWEAIGYKNLFSQINEADSTIECCRVSPFGEYYCDTIETLCSHIESLCKKDGRRYIYAYHFQPDSDAHKTGCYSERVKEDIVLFEKQLEKLASTLNDTLLIITADHGLADITYLLVEDFPQINECLFVPPTREPRSISFFVKPEFLDVFPERWRDQFGSDFLLMTGKDAQESGIFGDGACHKRVEDFLGDYIAFATGNLALWYKNSKGESNNFKACHAGLSNSENFVPLIIIDK